MVAAGMENRRARAVPLALLSALAIALAGCGGGDRRMRMPRRATSSST